MKEKEKLTLNREKWIAAVTRELAVRHGDKVEKLPANTLGGYQEWAAALAESYYDKVPNDFSPDEAVADELSNA